MSKYQILKKNYSPFLPVSFEMIILNENCFKVIYDTLNNNDAVPPVIPRWNNVLLSYFEQNVCIHNCFNVCFKITSDTIVHLLQYRTLNSHDM